MNSGNHIKMQNCYICYAGSKKYRKVRDHSCIQEHIFAIMIESRKIMIFWRIARGSCADSMKFPWHGFY